MDTQPLVTAAEWARVCARPVPACEGQPDHSGVDLGGSRSWSAAACDAGRLAVSRAGRLRRVCRRCLSKSMRIKYLRAAYRGAGPVGRSELWTMRAPSQISGCYSREFGTGSPTVLVSDPFRAAELHQVVAGRVRIVERARGGGESTSNVQALQVAAPRLQLRE